MTREEAIKIIKSECYVFNPFNFDCARMINTALDMAIKALEQEPSEDAISRAETVKFLANHSNEFEDAKIRIAFQSASSLVNNPHNLPSVQPKPKMGKWIDKKCSVCGCGSMMGLCVENYCPNCGSKMEVEE